MLLCIEVGGLHHPTVEGNALGGGQCKQFTLTHLVVLQLVTERLVVDKRLHLLTFIIIDGTDIRGIDIAPGVEEVLEVLAKDGTVPAGLLRQTLALAIFVGHPYALVCCTILMRSIINGPRLLVVAIDVADLIVALINLAQQLAIEVIKVEVHVAVAVAGQQNVTLTDNSVVVSLLTDVLVNLIFYGQLADSGQWISHIDTQAILMAIQRKDGNL